MYSWEITKVMEQYQYNLPSNIYLEITSNSPQIGKVMYHSCGERFEICDDEGICWNFGVYYEAS